MLDVRLALAWSGINEAVADVYRPGITLASTYYSSFTRYTGKTMSPACLPAQHGVFVRALTRTIAE